MPKLSVLDPFFLFLSNSLIEAEAVKKKIYEISRHSNHWSQRWGETRRERRGESKTRPINNQSIHPESVMSSGPDAAAALFLLPLAPHEMTPSSVCLHAPSVEEILTQVPEGPCRFLLVPAGSCNFLPIPQGALGASFQPRTLGSTASGPWKRLHGIYSSFFVHRWEFNATSDQRWVTGASSRDSLFWAFRLLGLIWTHFLLFSPRSSAQRRRRDTF